MGYFLYFLSYVSIVIHICFVTISFAAGLYYISEIVEEYTEKAKKVIRWSTFVTIAIYLLLMLTENFSWSMIICGLLAQVVHLVILRNFPNIKIVSIEFFGAVSLLLVNHYLAYQHFEEVFYSLSEVSAKCLCILKSSWPCLFIDFSVLHNLPVVCAICSLREFISKRSSPTILSRVKGERQWRRDELLFIKKATKPAELL